MPVTPNSIVTPQIVGVAQSYITSAVGDYGSTTAKAVRLVPLEAAPNGCLVKRLYAMCLGTCQATQLLLFAGTAGGLALRDTQSYPATSASTTARLPKAYFGDADGAGATNAPYSDANPLRLGPGVELWAAISVANAAGFVFVCEYEAY